MGCAEPLFCFCRLVQHTAQKNEVGIGVIPLPSSAKSARPASEQEATGAEAAAVAAVAKLKEDPLVAMAAATMDEALNEKTKAGTMTKEEEARLLARGARLAHIARIPDSAFGRSSVPRSCCMLPMSSIVRCSAVLSRYRWEAVQNKAIIQKSAKKIAEIRNLMESLQEVCVHACLCVCSFLWPMHEIVDLLGQLGQPEDGLPVLWINVPPRVSPGNHLLPRAGVRSEGR